MMNLTDLDDVLIPTPPPDPPVRPRWAIVTGTAPLRVRLTGDTNPLPLTPVDLAGGHQVGDRVFCLIAGRQLIIIGRRTN